MQDQTNATDLALAAFLQLREVCPEHEMLIWMDENKTTDEEFLNRFWKKSEPWENLDHAMVTMVAETNYFLEVNEVLKKDFNIEFHYSE